MGMRPRKGGVMRRIALLAAVTVLLAFSAAWADEGLKLAILDVQRVVDESEKGRKVSDKVREFTDKKRAEVEKKLMEREKKADELEKQIQSGIMSDEATKKKVEEFQKYAAGVEKFARESENEVRKFASERKKEIVIVLEGIIDDIGRERGYDMIFRYENVVYNSTRIQDITKDVIVEYDAMKEKGGRNK
jgi:outer membrane protein